MIKINFDIEPETDTWKKWRKKCRLKTKKVLEQFKQGKTPLIDKTYNDKRIKDDYYFNEDEAFHGKCVFCEKKISKLNDLDHYRPKNEIRDENNNLIYVKDKIKHPGYRCLAYDWQNLLPCCKDCNTLIIEGEKKIGKGTRFPVVGRHAINLRQIKNENPQLINPVLDNPRKHFRFNKNNGDMIPKTNKGKITEQILGLNRDIYRKHRKAAYKQVKDEYQRFICAPDEPNLNEWKKIVDDIKKGKSEYCFPKREALKILKKASGL